MPSGQPPQSLGLDVTDLHTDDYFALAEIMLQHTIQAVDAYAAKLGGDQNKALRQALRTVCNHGVPLLEIGLVDDVAARLQTALSAAGLDVPPFEPRWEDEPAPEFDVDPSKWLGPMTSKSHSTKHGRQRPKRGH